MICLLVMTDGRDTIHETIASASLRMKGSITHRIIHDDSGSEHHRDKLGALYPDYEIIGGPRSGFGGAISRAWAHITEAVHESWVFHLEDDFTFNRHINIDAMVEVLTHNRHVAQMALRRQPWNESERAAGGIVEEHPEDFVDYQDGNQQWLEHRRFFTTNPSLYRSDLCARGWPQEDYSEGKFGIRLLQDHPETTFGYWGSRQSGEWVHHIGTERIGTGY